MQFAEKEVWFIIVGFTIIMLFLAGIFALVINISRKRKLRHINEIAEEKIKLQQAQLEKKDAIIEERNRIITDLHDDIGATISSMHIYGDLAGSVWDTNPKSSKEMVSKITQQAKDLMARMGDIIWSMKPSGEEKYSFTARLKNYSSELLAPRNIISEFYMDDTLSQQISHPEVRKNILLIAKEAMNNIAKYSEASKATISLAIQAENILLSITDNGKGFETSPLPAPLEKTNIGNGIHNIQQRCKQLNGTCKINASHGQGVRIECTFPIAIISHTPQ